MNNFGGLIVTTPTDREIVMTRVFNAPRRWPAIERDADGWVSMRAG